MSSALAPRVRPAAQQTGEVSGSNRSKAHRPLGALTGGDPLKRIAMNVPTETGESQFVFELDGVEPAWFRPILRELAELLELPRNWNSYGAPPIAPRAVTRGMQVLSEVMSSGDTPCPEVTPTTQAGVQFEWHARGIDLELAIDPRGRVSALFEDRRSRQEWELEAPSDLAPIAAALEELSRRR